MLFKPFLAVSVLLFFGCSSNKSSNSPDNVPPSLTPIADRTASVGSTVSFVIEATDPDGDSLVFGLFPIISRSELVAGYFPDAALDSSTGTFRFTPQEQDRPSRLFEVLVRDPDGAEDRIEFRIGVSNSPTTSASEENSASNSVLDTGQKTNPDNVEFSDLGLRAENTTWRYSDWRLGPQTTRGRAVLSSGTFAVTWANDSDTDAAITYTLLFYRGDQFRFQYAPTPPLTLVVPANSIASASGTFEILTTDLRIANEINRIGFTVEVSAP